MTQSKYEELYHHGIKGQKWGIRRFQNEDGTRTAAGKKREREADDYKSHKTKRLEKTASRIQKDIDSYEPIRGKDLTSKKGKLIATKDDIEVWRNASVEQKNKIDERLKKIKDSERERKTEGADSITEKNRSAAAKKYINAKNKERNAYSEWTSKSKNGSLSDEEYDKYDTKTTKLGEEREKAFKESKASFKSNKTGGQKFANYLINGPIGAGAYNNLRAKGDSVGSAEAKVVISSLIGGPLGQLVLYGMTRKG